MSQQMVNVQPTNNFSTAVINIIIQSMEIPKSPKSLAYARLGKPNLTKDTTNEQQKKMKRNSTGNIYEQILGQFNPDQNKYIRDLVLQNEKQEHHNNETEQTHHRRKSYADLVVNSSKQKQYEAKDKEVKESRCKPKRGFDHISPSQSTVKDSGHIKQLKNNNIAKGSITSKSKPIVSSFRRDPKSEQRSFLDSLNCYLEQLSDTSQPGSRLQINGEKLSETIKIGAMGDQSYKLVSKLEQSQIKIKELKLKSYYQEKELAKYAKKQAKMKQSLYEMLEEIKQLTSQLSSERRQRKRLQKIIDSFEMQRQKPERKTISKHQLKLQQLQQDLNQLSENDRDRSQFDSSFRDYWKNGANITVGRRKSRKHIRIYDQLGKTALNESQIEKMFHSKYNSFESDQ